MIAPRVRAAVALAIAAPAIAVPAIAALAIAALGPPIASVGAQPVARARMSEWRAPWAEVLRMADRRVLETAVADRALAPGAPAQLRDYTLRALGQLGDPRAEPRLLAALGDGRGPDAASAAFALGLLARRGLSDSAWATLETVAATPGPAAPMAMRALVAAPPRAVRAIRAVLAAPWAAVATDKAPFARGAADALEAALVASGLLREAPAPPTELMRVADRAVARAAVYAAVRQRRAASVRGVLAVVTAGNTEPATAALAARGLVRGATGDTLADSARHVLERLAAHPMATVRVEAFQALGTHGEPAAGALRRGLTDVAPLARQAAVVGWLSVRRGDTLAAREAWAADTGLFLREAVAGVLSSWGVPAAPPEAEAWAASGDWRRRAIHARSLLPVSVRWAMGDASGFDAPLADPDPRVRRAALEGLTIVAQPPFLPRGAPERVRALTDDPSPLVRAAAWGILARTAPDTGDVPRALAAWTVAVRDTVDEDARTSIATFLGAAHARSRAAVPGDSGSADGWREAWTAAIAALPRPADPAEARRLLPMFRGVPPAWPVEGLAATERPLAWYAAVVRRIIEPALAGRPPLVVLATTRGTVRLRLDAVTAPLTAENFLSLARRRFFDGVTMHRVVPGFVVQAGDPTGTGSGGPGYAIRDELSPTPYESGILGMALSGPDTGGSQWFITLAWHPHLTGGYTVFGSVAPGGEPVVAALRQHDRIVRVTVP